MNSLILYSRRILAPLRQGLLAPAVCAVILALVAADALAAPPVIGDISASQRAGTKWVDISYDLSDPDTASLTVSLQISADGGTTWTVPVTSATGAIGAGVAPGLRRTVVWNAGTDWSNQSTTTMRFRLTAEDGTGVAPSGFALIPAGSFTMGDQSSPRVGYSVELPVRSVYLSAFYMGTTEVTKAQWDSTYSYAMANGYTFDNTGAGKASSHPVQTVSWYDVVKWCNARSQQEGLQPCYTVGGVTYKTGQSVPVCDFTQNGYRLPTEAEWEKAARGGLSAQNFPWGNTITHTQANYYSSSYSYDVSVTRGYHPTYRAGSDPYTSPVGSFSPNGYGLYDMAGNVWEWCWDWYSGSYSGAGTSDPRGNTSGSNRVLRGGSWSHFADGTRVAYRDYDYPYDGRDYSGFRLARGRL
jgi:formylglycine-generating enzyme